jgi:accessory gene regulator protein AgrB
MDMESEVDYVMMVESALKLKSPHIVNIIVEEIARVNMENEQNDNNEAGKKKKKKVCICTILLQLLNLIILFYRNNHLSTLQTMRRWRMFKFSWRVVLQEVRNHLQEHLPLHQSWNWNSYSA